MKIYVVSAGQYSERYVAGVFDDIEKATLFRDAFDCNELIEEYELNEMPDKVKQGLKLFWVNMKKDGAVQSVFLAEPDGSAEGEGYEPHKNEGYFYPISNGIYKATMWARDEQHAIKIANERRTGLIAENKI